MTERKHGEQAIAEILPNLRRLPREQGEKENSVLGLDS